METDWRKVITDSKETKIFEALEDPQWEWRTVGALAKISGLSNEEVRKVLNKYPKFIRKSLVPSQDGEDLYTLQQRYFGRLNIRSFFTDTSSSSGSS